MHVPSYPRVLALLLMLASIAGSAHAVEFDEKVKAPMVKDPAALRSQAQSYLEKFNALQATSQELIGNRVLAADRFDLTWQIQNAIDAGRPLGDLSALGLEARKEGGYRIDFNANPQWDRPDETLSAVFANVNWQGLGSQLIGRGFRDEDVAKLREYVSTHNLEQSSRRETLPLALSFSKIVRKYDKIKRPVDDAAVLSYIYQREKLRAEGSRAWAEGLFDSVDAQRVRILMSYVDEMQSSGVWAPSNQRAGIDEQLRLMRLPDFERLATAEAMGGTP